MRAPQVQAPASEDIAHPRRVLVTPRSSRAAQVDDADGLGVFSRASVAAGLAHWSMDDVTGGSGVRLYRAVATELSVLDATTGHGRDERFVVDD